MVVLRQGLAWATLPMSPWWLLTLGCAVGPALTFGANLASYRRPRHAPSPDVEAMPQISVLIPARNEEGSIEAAVESVLASRGVDLELLVLDDASTDATAALVQAMATRDERVRLYQAPKLPPGWNGKQHACHTLSEHARYARLCFLDADVRVQPQALADLLAEMEARQLALLSGFPLEEAGTWLEKMLIPMIHFVLLCYLPVPALLAYRKVPALAAGCGQLMLVDREAYRASKGHAAIRQTMHDGILLPQLLRKHGYATGLVDLTDLARCRMYRNAREVWQGLGKNATEGMAAPRRIVPFTVMLFFGQVMPVVWLAEVAQRHGRVTWPLVAVLCGYGVRAVAAVRFKQSVFGALMHPLAVAVLLVLQWWSLGRKLLGRQAVWKQRAYDLG